MTVIVATLTIVQEGQGISLRSSVAEEHEASIPAQLIEIAQDAASRALARHLNVSEAQPETVWETKQ